jgi:hypothetical protein
MRTASILILCAGLLAHAWHGGAPIPGPRPSPPLTLVGVWAVQWSGLHCVYTFRSDGSCQCKTAGGIVWEGTWRLKGRTLTVVNERLTPTVAGDSWSLTFDDDMAGATTGDYVGVRVTMRKVRR